MLNLSDPITKRKRIPSPSNFLSVICDGPALIRYQQLLSGAIDWRVPVALSEAPGNVCAIRPPKRKIQVRATRPPNGLHQCGSAG